MGGLEFGLGIGLGLGLGLEKWSKARRAASFWASLEDLEKEGVWKDWSWTKTEAEKEGLWSRPCFVVEYFGKLHDRF